MTTEEKVNQLTEKVNLLTQQFLNSLDVLDRLNESIKSLQIQIIHIAGVE